MGIKPGKKGAIFECDFCGYEVEPNPLKGNIPKDWGRRKINGGIYYCCKICGYLDQDQLVLKVNKK